MKKVILSAAILAMAGFTAVNAKSIETTTGVYSTVQDSTQSKDVKIEDLPAAVKTTLAADAYKDWTPVSAKWSKTQAGEVYHVTVKKGDEQGVLKIDAAGKVVQ